MTTEQLTRRKPSSGTQRPRTFSSLVAALGVISSLPAKVIGSAGSSFGPSVRGKLIWDSSSKGTFNAGRNAAKRAKQSEQKRLRAYGVSRYERLRDEGLKVGHFPKLKNLRAVIKSI